MKTPYRFAAALLVLVLDTVPARAAVEDVAVIETSEGTIVWRFFDADAPRHAAYVRELIGRGFYDGTTFHRVLPHFVIQGGDPLSKDDDRSDDGEGEADRRLPAEFSPSLHYRPGTVGMARDVDPDSGSCQFFVALENLPRLDGRYTIFGEVVEGIDVARRIGDLPRDGNDNPLGRVTVRARIERREVPERVVSRETGPSGEILTGPDKPKFFDRGNVLWQPPRPSGVAAAPPGAPSGTRLDLAIDESGRVIDVRFPDPRTQEAARLARAAFEWTFEPATYDARPQKTRFEIGADLQDLRPSTVGSAPLEVAAGVVAPIPAPRVELVTGTTPPARAPRLRLTIDAAGDVADAALQSGSGDSALDAAALEAARGMTFQPATRTRPGREESEPVVVYLDVEARFVMPAP